MPSLWDGCDLNAKLKLAFGDNWASDPTIYAGLAGVYSNSDYSEVIVNGDAARTLYVSASRDSGETFGEASSSPWYIPGDTALSDASGQIIQQNRIFADTDTFSNNNYNESIVISPVSVSQIDDMYPLIAFGDSVYQGAAFGTFDGGVQQAGGTYEPGGSTAFALDL